MSETPGPFLDFGSVDDGPVEVLDAGRVVHHDDVLVCASCFRKATALVPEVADMQARHASEVGAIRADRDRATALALELSANVAIGLAELQDGHVTIAGPAAPAATPKAAPVPESVETSGNPEPEPEPPKSRAAVPKPPEDPVADGDISRLTSRQLRLLARDHDITIPADVVKRDDIRELIEDALDPPADPGREPQVEVPA